MKLFLSFVNIAILTLFIVSGLASAELDNKSTKSNSECYSSKIAHSNALIQFLLNDIKSTYAHDGGGGISEIKQTQTNVFVVSIAQE